MQSKSLIAMTGVPLLMAAGLMAASFPDPPKVGLAPASGTKTAVLAGGCFWGMEGIYEHVKGVVDTKVGFSGGAANTAHYERVSEGDTNHAESIKIVYDPSKITYGELLKIFFGAAHDPTTLNRQHYDVGTQYRSAIFYGDEEQKKVAEDYIRQLDEAHVFKSKIVTQVAPLKAFYQAEDYHQHYLDHNPKQPYIANVDIPLLNNYKATFPEFYR
jgi:peptide-methionine (S)-S-oxide reductase